MGKTETPPPRPQASGTARVGAGEPEFPRGSWWLPMPQATVSPRGQPLAWRPASCHSQALGWSSLGLL